MYAIILCMSAAMFKVHCIFAVLGFLASHVTAWFLCMAWFLEITFMRLVCVHACMPLKP